jgi:hypothetical protein
VIVQQLDVKRLFILLSSPDEDTQSRQATERRRSVLELLNATHDPGVNLCELVLVLSQLAEAVEDAVIPTARPSKGDELHTRTAAAELAEPLTFRLQGEF